MLTGVSLGILLIYLLEEAQAATGQARRGGRLDDPFDQEPGQLQARAGRIEILPLDSVDVDPAAGRNLPSSGSSQFSAGELGSGASDGMDAPSAPTPRLLSDPGAPLSPAAGSAGADIAGPGTGSPAPPSERDDPVQDPVQDPDQDQDQDQVPPGPVPQLVLVLVRTVGGVSSRSVEDAAASLQNATQVGIENTLLDLRSAKQGLRLDSDRTLQSFALSQLDDADLSLVAEHIGLLNSTVLNGSGSDVLVLNARDLLEFGVFTPTTATARVQSDLMGIKNSTIQGYEKGNQLALEALSDLTFTGLGESERAHMSFNLLTTALRDSGILMGNGHDTVTINSGYTSANQSGLNSGQSTGLTFDLGDSIASAGDGSNWSFSLNARAVGLENSMLDVGAGDDRVSILTTIDTDLRQDLGILYDDPFTAIKLERVGLLNSAVRMGDGNDVLRVNGAVIDSIIDLGEGSNTLLLEGAVSGSSRILMGDGNNTIIANAQLGGEVQGGEGDDRFSLRKLQFAGMIDGGAGTDSLEAPWLAGGRREVLVVSGENRGNLDGFRFRNIESVDLGSGNDVAILDFEGSLTGQLLGGTGLDRLEFNNWKLPVSVDLDLGSATGLGALWGFEQVVGGLGNDTLISSGAFSAIDGAEGDDLLFLRWSPWLSGDLQGLQARGGSGRDLFVFSGLEQQAPQLWDGRRGLPDLVDLDLLPNENGGIGLSDTIGWLRREPDGDGGSRETFQRLTPSGLQGVGDARLMPIAPLEQLLAGMSSDTQQLAIALDGNNGSQLHLLGSQGIGTSQLIANLPSALSNPGLTSLSGSSGSTP